MDGCVTVGTQESKEFEHYPFVQQKADAEQRFAIGSDMTQGSAKDDRTVSLIARQGDVKLRHQRKI